MVRVGNSRVPAQDDEKTLCGEREAYTLRAMVQGCRNPSLSIGSN
jgi:hypothetical protein